MLDPELPEDRREALAKEAAEILSSGGTIAHTANWGVRKMTFEIEHRGEADYRFWRFEADNALLEKLDHQLKITDGILRFRVFRVEADAPLVVPPVDFQLGGGERRGRGDRDRDRGERGDRDRDREPAR